MKFLQCFLPPFLSGTECVPAPPKFIRCCCLVTKLCLTLCDPMDCSCQGLLPMGFPRQEYWSELPFPSPEDPLDPGIKLESPALVGRFFTTEPPGKPAKFICWNPTAQCDGAGRWWGLARVIRVGIRRDQWDGSSSSSPFLPAPQPRPGEGTERGQQTVDQEAGSHSDAESASTLVLDLPVSRTVRNREV